MDNEQLFGPPTQQKRILALLRKKAERIGAPEPAELVPDAPMADEMKAHIYQGFERCGASRELLGVIGSWGDTLDPHEIQELLEEGYTMDTVFASTSD